MNKLITIGEFLIDFSPAQIGPLKTVNTFSKHAGGAPANVAVANQKLGGHSSFITKLGNDPFGDFLIDVLTSAKVDTSHVLRTNDHPTSLAFVGLKSDGSRDFTFYRDNASDLNIHPDEIDEALFTSGDILHFCSVDLVESPTKYAHLRAIEYALRHHLLISFDPNLRFPLWGDLTALKTTVNEFIDYADIVKISDDELAFITGLEDETKAVEVLFRGRVQVIIITKGSKGAALYTKNKHFFQVKGVSKNVVDTTGAGDAFIGGFLNRLLNDNIEVETLLSHKTDLETYLRFANIVAALTCQKYGAIPALPTLEEVLNA